MLEKPPWGSVVRMGHIFPSPHKLRMWVLEIDVSVAMSQPPAFRIGAKPHPAPCKGFGFHRGLEVLREGPGLCVDPRGGTWGDIILISMYLFHVLNVFGSTKPVACYLLPLN